MPTRSRRSPAAAPSPAASPSGIAVDAYGAPTVDPTKNVLDHVAAVVRRLDDLLEMQDRVIEAKLAHQAQLGELRAEHARELRDAESSRLDAIRQVDVLAVQTLAQASKDTAEALRVMVDSTAKAIAAQTSASMATVNDRLSLLERSSYEGLGRSAVVDPAMNDLLKEVKALRELQASGSGRSTGMSALWVYILGGISLLLGVLGYVGK